MIKEIAIKTGNVKIRKTIVIIVGCGSADAVALAAHPGARGHVREGAIVIVVIQAIRKFVAFLRKPWQSCAIGEKDIHIAVTVVIKKRDSTGYAVDHWLVGKRAVVEDKANAGILLPIFESNSSGISAPQRLGRSRQYHDQRNREELSRHHFGCPIDCTLPRS